MKCPYCGAIMNRTVEEFVDKIIIEYECPKCGYRDKHIKHKRPKVIKPYLPPVPPYTHWPYMEKTRWIVWGEPTPHRLVFWRKG